MERAAYYDRHGRPVFDVLEWARLYEEAHRTNTVHVADSEIKDADGRLVRVSTVWVGIDLEVRDDYPMIFETMIFGPGTPLDGHQWRWSSEIEAAAGHLAAVELVASGS